MPDRPHKFTHLLRRYRHSSSYSTQLALLSIAIVALTRTPAAADDFQVCPDLGQHEQILHEGEQQLQHAAPTKDPYLLPDTFSALDDSGDLAEEMKSWDLQKLREMNQLLWFGFRCQRDRQYHAALNIFLVQLQPGLNKLGDQPADTDDKYRADTLEALANLYVVAGSENIETDPPASAVATPHTPHHEPDPLWKIVAMLDRPHEPDSPVAIDLQTRANCKKAEQYYQRAIELRKQTKALPIDLLHDQIAVAMLHELFGEPDAAARYQEAATSGNSLIGGSISEHLHGTHAFDVPEIVPGPRYWLVQYLLRCHQWQALCNLHQRLVDCQDDSAIAALVAAYAHEKRNDEIMQLFEKIAAGKTLHAYGFPLTAHDLAAVIDLADAQHKQAICAFVDKWVHANANSAVSRPFEDQDQPQDYNMDLVATALWKKGWDEQAQRFYCTWIAVNGDDYSARLDYARCQLRGGHEDEMTGILSSLVSKLGPLAYGQPADIARCLQLTQRISQLYESATDSQSPGPRAVKAQVASLQQRCQKRLQQLQCLETATRLDHTGWKLEKGGAADGARKMYAEALVIRRKNLPQFDRTIAADLINLARLFCEDKNYAAADPLFAEAIAIYQKHPLPDDTELQSALQSYGDMLQRSGLTARAKQIYATANKLTQAP